MLPVIMSILNPKQCFIQHFFVLSSVSPIKSLNISFNQPIKSFYILCMHSTLFATLPSRSTCSVILTVASQFWVSFFPDQLIIHIFSRTAWFVAFWYSSESQYLCCFYSFCLVAFMENSAEIYALHTVISSKVSSAYHFIRNL